MQNKKGEIIQLTVKLPKSKVERIRKYANKHNDGNISETIRVFINKGLSINSYKEEITFLRQMINEEIKNTMEPYMDRLIKISVKGSVMSASSHFLCAKAIEKFIPSSKREDYKENLTEAKKLGVTYVSSNNFNINKKLKNLC